jgi:hypothetical protein
VLKVRSKPHPGTTAVELALVVAILAVALALIVGSFSSGTRDAPPGWRHRSFRVLHKAGTLVALYEDQEPPDPPPGDEWVRPVVYRCTKDGTEFVAFHRRVAPEPDEGGMRMMQMALPGGPWYGEDDPRAYALREQVACPTCGAPETDLEPVTPDNARQIWEPEE